ncbi:MAG: hypothetical protein HY026_03760 [Deltaproteobacteria bacterium]|nr:hypothetical protein [Deltaproteobacteria bacterium]
MQCILKSVKKQPCPINKGVSYALIFPAVLVGQFNFWYNHIRPHQNLDGRTPAEVWNGVDVFKTRPKKEFWFEAWDGLLKGIYLRL